MKGLCGVQLIPLKKKKKLFFFLRSCLQFTLHDGWMDGWMDCMRADVVSCNRSVSSFSLVTVGAGDFFFFNVERVYQGVAKQVVKFVDFFFFFFSFRRYRSFSNNIFYN